MREALGYAFDFEWMNKTLWYELVGKVTTYWHYFNLVRPNRGKEWQSPLQILKAKAPALAGAVLNWIPLNLAQRHHLYLPPPHHRGHDLPSFPSTFGRTYVRTPRIVT